MNDRCHVCGEDDQDLMNMEVCAACRKWFCDDCGGWCHEPDDEPNGDWFCVECQDETEPEDGK